MRRLRIVSLVLVATAILLSGSVRGLADGGASLPPQGPDPDDRREAAVASRDREHARLEAAEASFESDLASSSSTIRNHLVSFSGGVPARSLLEAIAEIQHIELLEVFTWTSVGATVFPVTGTFAAADVGWPERSPAEVADHLGDETAQFLAQRSVNLAAAMQAQGAGALPGEARTKSPLLIQVAETEQLRELIDSQGALLYGIRCWCSPASLEALEASVPGLDLRAVERDSDFQAPVWPHDIERDLVITSGGSFGL